MADKNLIKILKNIAVLLEIKGENPFKARAYANAAEIMEKERIDVVSEVKNNTLGNIKGFGEALQKKINDYVVNGRMSYYEKLISEIPESLVQITKVAGLGPKKTKMLYEQFSITNITQLEEFCLDNRLADVKGFSQKSIEGIINSIQHIKAARGRYLQQQVLEESNKILKEIKKIKDVKEAEFTGDFRRFTETLKNLHLLIACSGSEDLKSDINISSIELPVKIEIVEPDTYFWRLNQATGSDIFIGEFNKLSVHKGYQISPNGISAKSDLIKFESEEDIFKLLDIQYIPPELREGAEIITDAINYKIPKLVEESDLMGMLHCHSTWSDGKNSIKEMAVKSNELGFQYFGICDHSKSAFYANGMTPGRVLEQHKEIDKLNNEELGIKIIKGVESDILSDGALDYDESLLKKFHFVVASIHSSFKMSKERMTKRMIYALQSPYTKIIGHPTGRLLLARPPYEIDIHSVIDAASEYGKVIEINSNPYRLDLSWENVLYAKKKGLKVAINPDSHSTETLSDVFIGVKVARKGGLEKSDVVNCLDYDDFIRWISH